MRIATWNVNSLKARLERVEGWLAHARPDVLLMQETKLSDDAVPEMSFRLAGYSIVHHGEGRWNGVAIVLREGLEVSEIVTNFGDGPVRSSAAGAGAAGSGGGPAGGPGIAADEEDFDPFDEARMVSALVRGDPGGPVRVVSCYAPNGRIVDSPFYLGKLAWFDRLARWLAETRSPDEPLVVGGDLNVAPADLDVWEPALAHGGTHVSPRERAAFRALVDWGLVDTYRAREPEGRRFTWWDYRAGNFQRDEGMRIDHLLATRPLDARIVALDIDREARKGKPTPSDHAPVFLDLDAPGSAIDTGWAGAEARIAARRGARG